MVISNATKTVESC